MGSIQIGCGIWSGSDGLRSDLQGGKELQGTRSIVIITRLVIEHGRGALEMGFGHCIAALRIFTRL